MNPESETEKRKSDKLTLLALSALFMIPIIIAYLGWWMGWFNDVGKTNHGRLLTPVITYEQAGLTKDGTLVPLKKLNQKWWIIYVSNEEQCHLSCQANAYLINQVKTAQAKETSRVDRMLIKDGRGFSSQAMSYVKEHFEVSTFFQKSDNSLLKANKIYLMDPHGNIMLEYDAVKDEKEAVKKGGGLIKDLKKLLKISQIG